ncbi:MAG TPA: SAM-dependent methyltransferase [Ktedonobacterales bacterium]|nr:SAM-dependent methyltransferase [Ktedonobacterales bacterium]
MGSNPSAATLTPWRPAFWLGIFFMETARRPFSSPNPSFCSDQTRVTTLTAIITDDIANNGPMTFAHFMAIALYHPTLGYYNGGGQGHEPLGWRGDYFTSGDVHPLWGWTLARQLHQMWELLGRPSRFDVVEPGAGRGLLARETWRYALERAPEWAAALHYTLVDRATPGSSLRAARERRLLAELATLAVPAGGITWANTLATAAPNGPITGCVISNELVDALPVHVVTSNGGELRELYVAPDERTGTLTEVLGPPSAPEVASYLDTYRVPWRRYPDGWRAEISLDAILWMREVAALLRRGFALTIDYGDTARRLYTPDRYRGTLAVYSRHQMGGDPLVHPGSQDLTAHVNFTALIEAGRAARLRLAGLTTQGELLRRLGIIDEMEALGARLYPAADTERHTDRGQADQLRRMSLRGATSTLLNPRGLGGFRVLAQQRGVPGAARTLQGFVRQLHGNAR